MRRFGRIRNWLIAPLAIVTVSVVATSARGDDSLAGSQGVDTSLPLTDSAVTAQGRGRFADLAITVNQTQALTNQAVSITWTGGVPTTYIGSQLSGNFLQIMECWGDDDGTNPDNPGPPPEQCVQGAVAGRFGGISGGRTPAPGGLAMYRIISRSAWANFDESVGVYDSRTGQSWMPFHAVDGTEVGVQIDPTFNPAVVGGNFWLNSYFNIVTTNEITGATTAPDGTGAELFQVQTGVQSSGLGCGQHKQPVEGGESKIPQCWIVVVPRGAPADENAGTPFDGERAEQFGVMTSPLAPDVWQNRIAIPIDFNPVDSPCSLGNDERRMAGSELALSAIVSWQPTLCSDQGLPPFTFAPISDSQARQQLAFGGPGAPGLVAVSRPLPSSLVNPDKPVVYAPLTASGIAIGFNIERTPRFDAPDDAQRLAGIRVAELNLTPRLVAKLLTQSYLTQLTIFTPPDYDWMIDNPNHLGVDPDFLQFNPEFAQLQTFQGRQFGGLSLPAGNSDTARQLWEWVLADPEARAWLDGEPDEWGMRVNPYYSTDAETNPLGVPFGDPIPSSFPKADAYCYHAPPRGLNNSIVPPPLCGTDWMPYLRGLSDAAQATRKAFDGARIGENPFAESSTQVWTSTSPQLPGQRTMLSVTDTASAAQYGIQVARLSRAGDDGPDRRFNAPDDESLVSGLESMAAGSEPDVLEPNPLEQSPGAYPLTTLTYAVVSPLDLDTEARDQYASFIDFVTGDGQRPGPALGELPKGYVPLPQALHDQSAAAADLVRTMQPPPPPESTTTTTTTTTTTATTTTLAPVTTQQAPPPAFTPQSNSSGQSPRAQNTTTQTTAATTSTIPASVVPASSTPVPSSTEPPVAATTEPTATSPTPTTQPQTTSTTSSPPTPTPETDLNVSRMAIPVVGALALVSALVALEITKRPRRSATVTPSNLDPPGAPPS